MAATNLFDITSKDSFLDKLGEVLARHGSQAADVRALLALPQAAANTDWRAEAEKLLKERQAFEGLLGGGQPKSSILATVAGWGWAVLTAPRLQGAVLTVVLGVLGYFGLDFWQQPRAVAEPSEALSPALRGELETFRADLTKELKQSFQDALKADQDGRAKAETATAQRAQQLVTAAKQLDDSAKAMDQAAKASAKASDDLAKLDIPGSTAKKVEEKLNAADLPAKVGAKVSADLKDLPDKTAKKVEDAELIKKIAAKLDIK